jgi:hypothetical protein
VVAEDGVAEVAAAGSAGSADSAAVVASAEAVRAADGNDYLKDGDQWRR